MENRRFFQPSRDSQKSYSQFLGKSRIPSDTTIKLYDSRKDFFQHAPRAFFLGTTPDLPETPRYYRGDSRPWKEIKQAGGFEAPGQYSDILTHTNIDSLIKGGISASTSKKAAAKFPYGSVFDFPEPFHTISSPTSAISYLYEFQSREKPIHVPKELSYLVRQGQLDIEDFGIMARKRERLFLNKIKDSQITGYWEVEISKIQVKDPAIFSGSPYSQEFIAERCFEYQRTISPEFVPNPEFKASLLPRIMKDIRLLGSRFTAFGLSLDALNLYEAWRESEKAQNYSSVIKEAARVTSGWSGAAAGAAIGLELCAPIAPPWGPMSCALLGSGAGYYFGSRIAASQGDKIVEAVEKTKAVVEEATTECSTALRAAKHVAVKKGAEVIEKVGRGAGKFFKSTAAVFFATQDGAARTQYLRSQGIDNLQATVCGHTGGAIKTIGEIGGDAAILGISIPLAETGPGGCVAAAALIQTGFPMVENGSKKLGDAAQGACMQFFQRTTTTQLKIINSSGTLSELRQVQQLNFVNNTSRRY